MCPSPPKPPGPSGDVPVPSNCSDHTGERHWPAWSLKGEGYFIQLSDLHVDMKYTVLCSDPHDDYWLVNDLSLLEIGWYEQCMRSTIVLS
jgi:hypothetical protein